ncbi:MAG: DUF885 domain-containing protein, partial [Hymenobacteraceae bacterium]|nr:DUF885 domain-containing protein [Hymenobacteraceae bacterium]
MNKKTSVWRWLGRGLLGVLAVVAVLVINVIWFKPFFIRAFYERVFVQAVFQMPELLSSIRLVEPLGMQGHNQELDDASEAFTTKQIEQGDADLAMLHSYDRAALQGQAHLSYDVLDWFLTDAHATNAFRYDNYPVNQLFGVQNGFPTFMATVHQVHNRRDADYYNLRLSKVGRKFGQVLEGLKVREQHGVVPPTFVIDKVLTEMLAFVATAPEQNILYTALVEKLGKTKDFAQADKDAVLAEAKKQITGSVYPAYGQLITFFADQRTRSTNDAGVWKFPDGAAYYVAALRTNTTTDYTPEQIHQLGLTEVARISAEMLTILHAQGY